MECWCFFASNPIFGADAPADFAVMEAVFRMLRLKDSVSVEIFYWSFNQ